mmetsp:Transcript_6047/g.25684  ORF Transcript_6047/g.25684 Transcript_6047/m.25684 type:complete len:273 (-) Transcript_6047:10-828(-)
MWDSFGRQKRTTACVGWERPRERFVVGYIQNVFINQSSVIRQPVRDEHEEQPEPYRDEERQSLRRRERADVVFLGGEVHVPGGEVRDDVPPGPARSAAPPPHHAFGVLGFSVHRVAGSGGELLVALRDVQARALAHLVLGGGGRVDVLELLDRAQVLALRGQSLAPQQRRLGVGFPLGLGGHEQHAPEPRGGEGRQVGGLRGGGARRALGGPGEHERLAKREQRLAREQRAAGDGGVLVRDGVVGGPETDSRRDSHGAATGGRAGGGRALRE